jgi:DNA-binding GntR family transcriptional regulator
VSATRFRRVAADLRDRLALGETGADGALPSEADLCTRYGVSRMTIRRALEELRDEGLLASRPGAGWFLRGSAIRQPVALGSFTHAASAAVSLGDVRRRIVDFGYRTVPGPLPADDGQGSQAPGPFGDVLYVRSVRSADGEPLDAVHEYAPADVAAPISRSDAESPGLWETISRNGHQIAKVRQTITAGVARAGDAELLEVSTGAPLLLIQRLALDPAARILARAEHRYLAQRFSLTVEFTGWTAAAATEPPGLSLHDDTERSTT